MNCYKNCDELTVGLDVFLRELSSDGNDWKSKLNRELSNEWAIDWPADFLVVWMTNDLSSFLPLSSTSVRLLCTLRRSIRRNLSWVTSERHGMRKSKSREVEMSRRPKPHQALPTGKFRRQIRSGNSARRRNAGYQIFATTGRLRANALLRKRIIWLLRLWSSFLCLSLAMCTPSSVCLFVCVCFVSPGAVYLCFSFSVWLRVCLGSTSSKFDLTLGRRSMPRYCETRTRFDVAPMNKLISWRAVALVPFRWLAHSLKIWTLSWAARVLELRLFLGCICSWGAAYVLELDINCELLMFYSSYSLELMLFLSWMFLSLNRFLAAHVLELHVFLSCIWSLAA